MHAKFRCLLLTTSLGRLFPLGPDAWSVQAPCVLSAGLSTRPPTTMTIVAMLGDGE